MSKDAEARVRCWGAPVPAHLKHGKNTRAASIYGCDCTACLPSGRRRPAKGQGASATERMRKLRATKLGTPVPPTVKHGLYANRTYGCKCDVCMAANRAAWHQKANAWRERATGDWAEAVNDEGVAVDVLHWPPRGIGMWECPHCEQKFPRRG